MKKVWGAVTMQKLGITVVSIAFIALVLVFLLRATNDKEKCLSDCNLKYAMATDNSLGLCKQKCG